MVAVVPARNEAGMIVLPKVMLCYSSFQFSKSSFVARNKNSLHGLNLRFSISISVRHLRECCPIFKSNLRILNRYLFIVSAF